MVFPVDSQAKPLQTAAAILAAMEMAHHLGDSEVAERLFVSYRLLFAEPRISALSEKAAFPL